MKYKEENEKIITDTGRVDDDVLQYIKSISAIIDFDLSQFEISNIYSLNAILDSPDRFINDADTCQKIRDLKELIRLMGGLENVSK